MNNGRPWFKFFPADWLGSRETRFLTPEERGYLIQLISEAWQSEPCGSLPADTDNLWRLAGAKSRKQFEPHAEAVLQSFRLQDGRYWNQNLVSLYEEIEKTSIERRIAGSLGARKRWQTRSKPMANASETRWQTDGDIEEMRKEEEKEVDPEKQSPRKNREREARASSLGSIAGLAKAVFEDKAMPRATMNETELQARKRELREQAERLKETPHHQ
jgi:uncharacterized protein YdaU (DUF1376 family)